MIAAVAFGSNASRPDVLFDRQRLGRIEALEDVDDDDGDVVAAPAVVGHRDEDARGLVGIVGRGEHLGDAVVGHLVEQAVAAEQVAVARERRDLPRVDPDLAVDAERSGEDVALRVHLRLLGRDRALAHHALHEAVILGDLDERAVLQHVHA